MSISRPTAPYAPAYAAEAAAARPRVGAVAIGRNEGERLVTCLRSLREQVAQIVYVDSGSTDGSVENARQLGVTVVSLDMRLPFTAARARNAGWRRLVEIAPHLEFVQFIDGDCELQPHWIAAGVADLDTHPLAAITTGSRHERHPERSLYNLMCDIEWYIPLGEIKYCGGDSLARLACIREVDGFREGLIAGEEPELCVRLRGRGWTIRSILPLMSIHDAAMTQFGQWWRRNVRTGYAYAEGASLHGRPPERHWVRESRSIWFWGLFLPLFCLLTAWPTHGASLLLLLGYPVLAVRIYRHTRYRGIARRTSWLYALATVLGKFAQVRGQLQFIWGNLRGRRSRLIEYKKAPTHASLAATAVAPVHSLTERFTA